MMENLAERSIAAVKRQFERDKDRLFLCLAATFVWGLMAHAFGFLHGNFSHDSLNAFYATAVEEAWKVELGRFLVPIYRAVVRGGVALPWIIGLLALTYIGIAAFLIVKMFDIKSRTATALICGIMVTNITVTAMTATYLYELDFDMLALLFAVGAAYVWKIHHGKITIYALGGGNACCLNRTVSKLYVRCAYAHDLLVHPVPVGW